MYLLILSKTAYKLIRAKWERISLVIIPGILYGPHPSFIFNIIKINIQYYVTI